MKPLKRKDAPGKVPKQVGLYQHPAVRYGMCQQMFCWLLDITTRTLQRMITSKVDGGRRASCAPHGNRGETYAAKPEAKAHYVKGVERIAAEHGHPQPWPLPGLKETKPVLVLPPQFSQRCLHRMVTTLPSTQEHRGLVISMGGFNNLFNSDALQHIHISMTERGMCVKCTKWNASLRALATVPGDDAYVKKEITQRLKDNHTMKNRMGRQLYRETGDAIRGQPRGKHQLQGEAVADDEDDDADGNIFFFFFFFFFAMLMLMIFYYY